jgi:ADP-ribosylglycohydrolase
MKRTLKVQISLVNPVLLNQLCFCIQTDMKNFWLSGNPYAGSTDACSAGSDSLMRLAQVSLFYYRQIEHAVAFTGESSRTTHGSDECIDACQLYSRQLLRALARIKHLFLADSASLIEAHEIAGNPQ